MENIQLLGGIQATEFAKWRTNMVTEMTLRNSGYLSRDSKNTSTAEGNFDKDTYVTHLLKLSVEAKKF